MTDKQRQDLMQSPSATQAEMDRCMDFIYFYNNYCRGKGDPELTQEIWDMQTNEIKYQFWKQNTRQGRKEVVDSFEDFEKVL